MGLTRHAARRVALFYLLMGLPGVPALTYLTSHFVVKGDAAATAQRIAEEALSYRLIVAGELVSMIFFVFLAWSLYKLFESVDQSQARLLVMFVLVSVVLGFVDVALLLGPLMVQGRVELTSAFAKPQLDALAFSFFPLRNGLLQADEALWGLWLLPFGILVIKSGYIPKFIGVFLLIGGVGWIVLSFSEIVLPAAHWVSDAMVVVTAPGELSILLWFILKSFTLKPTEAGLAYAR